MVYAPKFQEVADTLIVDNVMAIVKRDFKSALDYFYAADALPDFTERTLGVFFRLTYPAFNIDPDKNDLVQSEDGSRLEGGLKVNMFLAVEGVDAPTVTRKAMKYTRALRSILRTATVGDYTAGFPANSVFALNVEMTTEYGVAGKNANGYEKPVSFELLLKFNER